MNRRGSSRRRARTAAWGRMKSVIDKLLSTLSKFTQGSEPKQVSRSEPANVFFTLEFPGSKLAFQSLKDAILIRAAEVKPLIRELVVPRVLPVDGQGMRAAHDGKWQSRSMRQLT